MSGKKFQPPPRKPGESNHAYAARKSSELGRHNIEKAKEDKRRRTGDDRTEAQKRGDQTRGNKGGKRGPYNIPTSRQGRPGTHADPTLERTTKRHQLGPCSRCHGSGRQKVGIVNQRFVPCRKCGGGGQTWEKR